MDDTVSAMVSSPFPGRVELPAWSTTMTGR
jgi:hypothetical protein